MSDINSVWVRIPLPEELHTKLKTSAIQEKLPDGSRKTLQIKIIECLEIGYNKTQEEKNNVINKNTKKKNSGIKKIN